MGGRWQVITGMEGNAPTVLKVSNIVCDAHECLEMRNSRKASTEVVVT